MLYLVEMVSERPPEALSLLDKYLAGKIGTIDFAYQMENVKIQLLTARPATPTS